MIGLELEGEVEVDRGGHRLSCVVETFASSSGKEKYLIPQDQIVPGNLEIQDFQAHHSDILMLSLRVLCLSNQNPDLDVVDLRGLKIQP